MMSVFYWFLKIAHFKKIDATYQTKENVIDICKKESNSQFKELEKEISNLTEKIDKVIGVKIDKIFNNQSNMNRKWQDLIILLTEGDVIKPSQLKELLNDRPKVIK